MHFKRKVIVFSSSWQFLLNLSNGFGLSRSKDQFYCRSVSPDRWISRRSSKLCNEKVQWRCWFFGIFTKVRLNNLWISVRTYGLQAWQILVSCGWTSVKSVKGFYRSQILECPSIGEYWNISGVPVLPETVIFMFFRTCCRCSEGNNNTGT